MAVVGSNGSLSISTIPPPIPSEFLANGTLEGVTVDVNDLDGSELIWTMIEDSGVQDVAYGANGIIWITGTTNSAAGGDVKAYIVKTQKWSESIGSATRIAVHPTNYHPYIVNAQGSVYYYDGEFWI